jgi:hypothetical protein
MQINSLLLIFACIPLAAQPSASRVAGSEVKDVVPRSLHTARSRFRQFTVILTSTTLAVKKNGEI